MCSPVPTASQPVDALLLAACSDIPGRAYCVGGHGGLAPRAAGVVPPSAGAGRLQREAPRRFVRLQHLPVKLRRAEAGVAADQAIGELIPKEQSDRRTAVISATGTVFTQAAASSVSTRPCRTACLACVS